MHWPARRQGEGAVLTFADVCANSGSASEGDSFSGPRRRVFVSFRPASGGVLTFADVCANSGPASEKESFSGPLRQVSVLFQPASCGVVSSLWGVVARSGLQIACENKLF